MENTNEFIDLDAIVKAMCELHESLILLIGRITDAIETDKP